MDDANKPLKILMTSMIDFGHLNSCLGIGYLLVKRGHQVYLAHFPKNKSIIEKQGIKFISLYDYADEGAQLSDAVPRSSSNFKPRFERSLKMDPLEALKEQIATGSINTGFVNILERYKAENVVMHKIVDQLKPDICLCDYLYPLPWMFTVDCPVIPVKSTNPVGLYRGPPSNSGYSVKDSTELWDEFKALNEKVNQPILDKVNEIFQLFNVQFIHRDHVKYFGIYIYPGPLDYHELAPPKEKWVRLDSALREHDATEFELPEKLKDKPGKLIYISMGTLISAVTELLTMILTPLANSPHRFIVSTGPNGDSIKLHDNMWGDKFVDQVALLPKVDLFITHGGSNSLIEGLTAGKPLIVIPQFGDQPDNAQRVADLGLGVRLNLHEFSGEKLLKAIEDVLNNKEIHLNVARVSEELKKSGSKEKVVTLIEKLARNKRL
ncbi:uncharacterized UDP-glucosyltransferase YjiC-like [Tetranychus urticae]|uniref:UDP-glucuronosyltransferase n=1 Tax=Tetranychus urticae TaxID=32264 RepID=T1KUL5_TETUR|nr:uncharacterized UDP-glucosyltransferase YjiC-like [Tetranychus urticae]AHX56888.1 UDP-glycosyltransferase 202A15 [Tetranychus urticae]